MGLLSKFMNALIGEPPVSKTATQPGPKLARQNVPNPTQQQTTQRKSTVQSRQTQQLTQPSQSSQLARSSYRAQTQTTARNTSVTTNRSRAQSHANSQPAQKLMPQPMLPAEQIERARNIIGKIEKHELSDEQISAIAGAGHNTLVLARCGNRQNHYHRRLYRMVAEHRNRHPRRDSGAIVHQSFRRRNVEPHHAKHRQSHSRMHLP